MNEAELARLFGNQIGVTPRLDYNTKQTMQILECSKKTLRRLKQDGSLVWFKRGKGHRFNVLDIYAAQQAQRDLKKFEKDQVKV